MKVIVTGASGFVGRHVVKALRQQNVDVITAGRNNADLHLDLNDETTYSNLIEYCHLRNHSHPRESGDPCRLLHLAWQGLPNYLSAKHCLNELPKQLNFLTSIINQGITDVTVTGTCFEYGLKEGPLDINTICEPVTYYGVAKNALRQSLQILQGQKPFSLKWLRLFYLYGEGQAQNSLYTQLNLAVREKKSVFNMSHGDQERDFMAIEEAAKKIVDYALGDQTGIYNVCSGKPTSVIDFVSDFLTKKNHTMELNRGFYPVPSFEPVKFWGK